MVSTLSPVIAHVSASPQEPSAMDRYVTATFGNAAAKPEEAHSLSQPK